MTVYIITSPVENFMFLTVDPQVAEHVKQTAAECGAPVEISEWDTAAKPSFALQLEFSKPSRPLHVYAPVPEGGYHA